MKLKTASLTLRVSPDTRQALNAAAEQRAVKVGTLAGQIMDAWAAQQATGESDPEQLTLGFWKVTGGEVDGATCADCEQAIHGDPWMGVTTTCCIVGPLCARCARTD